METILFLAHTEQDGSLAKPALEALAAARLLAKQAAEATLAVGLAGEDPAAAANQIGSCGAARFLGVSGAEFAVPRYATDAAAAEALVRAAGATLIVAPSTSRWARCLGGVAQRLGGRIDTHITGIAVPEGRVTVPRWYYRQRMEALLARSHRPWFLLVDPGCFDPWAGEPAQAALEPVAAPTGSRTRFIEYRAPQAGEQTIRPDAKLLFVAGAGWTKKQPDGKVHVEEAAELILTFLRKTQASLGSSKSLVDLSGEGQVVLPFLSHLNQVGQTGSTPRHPKGLATCCHGEEPHVVGWRFIHERRAVNLDPNCGWAQGKADVLYVADAFAVLRKLNELL